jgi:transcription termination factor NusB
MQKRLFFVIIKTMRFTLGGIMLRKRSKARLFGVQALYHRFMRPEENPDEMVIEFLQFYVKSKDFDKHFFLRRMENLKIHLEMIDEYIKMSLPDDLNIANVETMLMCIFRSAADEILHELDVAIPVIIDEYLHLTNDFGYAKENGLIHVCLHKIGSLRVPLDNVSVEE